MDSHNLPTHPGKHSRSALIALAGLLAACGGGGGGSRPPTPTPGPSVSLDVNPASIGAGQAATLTWTSSNVTSCTASGAWSGTKATSGSESTGTLSADATFTLTCTGVGGQAADSATVTIAAPPTVALTAAPASVIVDHSTTLTWSSTGATSCTAAGGWSGAKATSGAESIGPLATDTTFTLTCTGPGGEATQSSTVTVTAPPPGNVVISGRITFDRIPFSTTPPTRLNPAAPVVSPARHVVVQAMTGDVVIAATTTDLNGRYALVVPVNTSMLVRARVQMLKADSAPTWDFRVLNNTNSGALYALDGTAFTSDASSTRNLHAPSGWGTSSYTGTRTAAPFAILDTVFQAKELILAAAPTTQFPALSLFWSADNRAATPFCPDTGNIGTSSYAVFGAGDQDECNSPGVTGIYILGDFANGNGDTDEFDSHVIAHEFGHYIEHRFSRSDSIGGGHSTDERLDLRVAFGEGWGNAYSAMSLGDALYKDSQGGVSDGFVIDVETDRPSAQGWFSEASVGEILWDLFDGTDEPGDGVALGFAPIFTTMTGPQVSTEALTSIFSFASALRSANPAASTAINTLLSGENISASDAFGSGESNNGGDTSVLPVYRDISLNAPLAAVCSTSVAGTASRNKLGNRKFLRFVNDATRLVTIQATGAAPNAQSVPATDPDIYVYRRGELVAFGDSGTPGSEALPQFSLAAGTYIIEAYDFDVSGTSQPPRCMTVSITGN